MLLTNKTYTSHFFSTKGTKTSNMRYRGMSISFDIQEQNGKFIVNYGISWCFPTEKNFSRPRGRLASEMRLHGECLDQPLQNYFPFKGFLEFRSMPSKTEVLRVLLSECYMILPSSDWKAKFCKSVIDKTNNLASRFSKA